MHGAKRSAEAVGCKKTSVGERSALVRSLRASRGGRSGSENVGLSNANIGENPMPRKPKGSSARVRRGRENASSQCSSTRRYGAEVTHAILPGKARTINHKSVPVPETDTGPTGQGTVSGRQFLWGVGLPKGNGGVQRFPRAGRRLALECKGRRELDCKTHPSSRDESRP
nr:hypothetical protein Saspl_050854 [Ipomoea trifida]GMC62936.1 Protein root UVB sensitive 1, chloroplastic [Ipomoea batatas]GLL16992.1 hypothetical protein Saspl_050854 [Ipomoea trifida]GLL25351.1 hypothetical protein Saspl_050854 [Ipomoea trifida]GLL25366.1 hypothetical protein Saspl_050854 [Ipomoea trifida]